MTDPSAEMKERPAPPPAEVRLVTVRTFVIGIVAMWLILVAGWAARRGFELDAAADRRQEVREARLQLAGVEDLQNVFKAVNDAMEPSVVKIDVVRPEGTPQSRGRPTANSGSGVIVEVDDQARRPFGYVVTNEHVVRNADAVRVSLSDGRTLRARVVGDDPGTDLAILRVQAEGLIAAEWGDSDALRNGDWVLAFGSPFGFVGSMTAGIVSALNRTQSDVVLGPFNDQSYQDFIQVDAAINPGNSGGPLVDVAGRVVGINTAIFSRSGDFSGVGFAIPSNQAKRVYEDIRDRGRVVRGWVGVTGGPLSELPGVAERLGIDRDGGVLIARVFQDTPAAEAGLRRGDVVTRVDGEAVNDFQAFRNAAGFAKPGDTLELEVVRFGERLTIPLVVGERPAGQLNLDLQPLGIDLYGLELADRRGGPPVVTAVAPRSPADEAGIRPGHRVYAVNDRPVRTREEAVELMSIVPPVIGVEVRVATEAGVFRVLLRRDGRATGP